MFNNKIPDKIDDIIDCKIFFFFFLFSRSRPFGWPFFDTWPYASIKYFFLNAMSCGKSHLQTLRIYLQFSHRIGGNPELSRESTNADR